MKTEQYTAEHTPSAVCDCGVVAGRHVHTAGRPTRLMYGMWIVTDADGAVSVLDAATFASRFS